MEASMVMTMARRRVVRGQRGVAITANDWTHANGEADAEAEAEAEERI